MKKLFWITATYHVPVGTTKAEIQSYPAEGIIAHPMLIEATDELMAHGQMVINLPKIYQENMEGVKIHVSPF